MNSGQIVFRKTPKVELHRHLEGAIRFSTLLELAPQVGIDLPQSLELLEDHFLVRKPMKDLAAVLNKFWMTQSVLNSEEILRRIAFEAVEDAFLEGIQILELRYAPTFIRTNHDHFTFEKIHHAIMRGLRDAENIPCAAGLLCTIQRILPIDSALNVMHFVLDHKDGFVGVDLADDEDSRPAKDFVRVFEMAQKADLPITIHAGESNTAQAPQNVIDSIEMLGARRIGHGVQVHRHPEALNLVRRKKIPLELCVTSNWLTHAVPDLHKHPIRQLIEAGVLVTLNSDDPGIFGISLSHEYELLAKSYGFNEADFAKANEIAAQASFIPLHKKQKCWPLPIHKI